MKAVTYLMDFQPGQDGAQVRLELRTRERTMTVQTKMTPEQAAAHVRKVCAAAGLPAPWVDQRAEPLTPDQVVARIRAACALAGLPEPWQS